MEITDCPPVRDRLKLLGTGKIFWHFSEGKAEILPIYTCPYIWCSQGQAKNSGGQVDLIDTFPTERQNFSVISTPG